MSRFHEPRSSRRESAPFSQQDGDQSGLTSAATVQRSSARLVFSIGVSLAGALLALNIAHAQRALDYPMVGSVSGEFFVSARSASVSADSLKLAAQPNMVALQPSLLVVSCERIKQELLRTLGMRDEPAGKIFIILQPAQSTDDATDIVPERFAGNWNCHVRLPDVIDRDRFANIIIHVCLLEIANRKAVDHPAEIPEWLSQGMAQQVIRSREEELILQPPDAKENGMVIKRLGVDLTDDPRVIGPNLRKFNPLADAIYTLHTNAPLTFDELSWPSDAQISGDEEKIYRSNAHLFVSQLLRLKDGPSSLQAMLTELPNYLNWQFAFLDAFHADFAQALDVEKWWAVEVTQFTGRDLLHLWTPEESWRQLDALFRFPIDVQFGPGAPLRTDVKFQTIIRGWSRTRQLQTLKTKLWDLDLVRMHVAPNFMALVDGYRQVLQDYYTKYSTSGRNLPQPGSAADQAIEETIQQLDELDDRRAAMRPGLKATVNQEQAETGVDVESLKRELLKRTSE